MPKVIRAAAIQAIPVFLDKRATIEKYSALVRQAGREGASLVVTPETGVPGYPYWRGSFTFTDAGTASEWREAVLTHCHQ